MVRMKREEPLAVSAYTIPPEPRAVEKGVDIVNIPLDMAQRLEAVLCRVNANDGIYPLWQKLRNEIQDATGTWTRAYTVTGSTDPGELLRVKKAK